MTNQILSMDEPIVPASEASERPSQFTKCDVLDVAAAKWTVEIWHQLNVSPTRTRRFLTLIPGLTMKSLRQRLQQLEVLGIVNRKELMQRPLRVEYSLTDRGRRFGDVLALADRIADEWNAAKP